MKEKYKIPDGPSEGIFEVPLNATLRDRDYCEFRNSLDIEWLERQTEERRQFVFNDLIENPNRRWELNYSHKQARQFATKEARKRSTKINTKKDNPKDEVDFPIEVCSTQEIDETVFSRESTDYMFSVKALLSCIKDTRRLLGEKCAKYIALRFANYNVTNYDLICEMLDVIGDTDFTGTNESQIAKALGYSVLPNGSSRGFDKFKKKMKRDMEASDTLAPYTGIMTRLSC